MASNTVHYPGTGISTFQWELDIVGAAPNIVGWRGIYTWASLEPTKGNYDFSVLDAELAVLKANSKRIAIAIWPAVYHTFHANDASTLPQYLTTDSTYGPGYVDSTYGYWCEGKSGPGYSAALWRPAVMDRFIALVQALGAHYNNDPNFELLLLPETASMITYAAPDYSEAALLTQLQRLLTAVVKAFPNTSVGIQNNYMQSEANTAALTTFAMQNRVAYSGPDIWGASAVQNHGAKKGYTWGQQDLLGISGVPGYTQDLRGLMPVMHEIEEPELDGTQFQGLGAPFPPQDLFKNANDNLHASHLFWTWLGAGPGNWSSVVSVINANPLTNTSCPASYGNQCSSD